MTLPATPPLVMVSTGERWHRAGADGDTIRQRTMGDGWFPCYRARAAGTALSG